MADDDVDDSGTEKAASPRGALLIIVTLLLLAPTLKLFVTNSSAQCRPPSGRRWPSPSPGRRSAGSAAWSTATDTATRAATSAVGADPGP